MTETSSSTPISWAPSSCTLPSVEQPLRLEEFDELIAQSVIAISIIDATTARLILQRDAATAARVATLCVHESACCTFFTFALSITQGVLSLDISVPDRQRDVLTALITRAATVSSNNFT